MREKIFLRHLLKDHPNEDIQIMCSFCPSTFLTEMDLNKHCLYNHDNITKCNICDAEYPMKKFVEFCLKRLSSQ